MTGQLREKADAGEVQEGSPSLSFKNILLATDFSESSFAAFPYLEALARFHGSQAYVVHVVGPGIVPLMPQQEQERMIGEAERKMQDFLRCTAQLTSLRRLLRAESTTALPCKPILERGEPSDIIRQLGQQLSIDLVVLGTNGRRGVKRFMLGSVAEEIFRLVPCPVLTVGPKARKIIEPVHFRRLLFATDFTPTSVAALPGAVWMAQQHQATLKLLSVVRSKKESARAKTQLSALVPERLRGQLQVESLVQIGSPVGAILRAAETEMSDLIILGVRCGGAWDRVATHAPGPIAYNVVAQAPCPVLTIRSHAESCAEFANETSA